MVRPLRIFPGTLGTVQTLRAMRRLANQGVRNPLTVNLANAIVESAAGDRYRQALQVRGWLDGAVQFQADPVGIETVRSVPEMLTWYGARGVVLGDCDDVAVLAAALGKASGLPARFVVLAFESRGPFRHVFTELSAAGSWVDMDVTRPPLPVRPTRAYRMAV